MRIYFPIILVLVLLISVADVRGQEEINSAENTKFPLIKTKGSVGFGYDYGILPFAQNISTAQGYFKADGNVNISVKSLPFTANFFYTNLRNINGLNNYFRISFDLQTFKSNLVQRKNEIKQQYSSKIPALNKEYQTLQQKIAYLNHVDNNIDHYFNLPDTSEINLPDSLSLSVPDLSSIEIDSSVQLEKLEHFKDSIHTKKEQYVSDAEVVLNKILEYQKIMDGLENPMRSVNYDTLVYKNKIEKFFNHVQKLEIGLCYPSYSAFLVNNIPLKGINFEYSENKKFFAFSAGTTINNLLFTNNIIQNNLQNTQNLFNFFDFSNPVSGRKIISAKTGFGKKNEDHIFIGALYGTGMQSYYSDTNLVSSNLPGQREHNVVMELDGKLKPKKWLELDLIYAKSSVRPLTNDTDTLNTSLTQLFSPFRSNAFLGKSQFKFSKLRSNITVSVRWVDPFFRSFGVGFMRSDNLRYEIKTNHQLGKKWNAGFFYRKDENNLLNLFSYKTILHSGGINLKLKADKHFTFTGIFNPVFQYSDDASTGTRFSNENYISSFAAIHSFQKKKISILTNLIGSYYKLYNGISNSEYLNVALSNSTTYKYFSNTITASWFDMKGMDSLIGNTFLLHQEATYRFKKLTAGAGLKLSFNDALGEQIGYHVKLETKVTKNISMELRGEKLVLGDFYNSIALDLYRSYPYIWSGRIIINW